MKENFDSTSCYSSCPLPMLMAVTMVAAIERSVVTRLSDSVTGVTIPPNGAELCRKYTLCTHFSSVETKSNDVEVQQRGVQVRIV